MKDNLYEELALLINQLKSSVKVLKSNGIDLANKERVYKEQLREEVTILREEGTDLKNLIEKNDFNYHEKIPNISRYIFFQIVCGLKILHEKKLNLKFHNSH